MSDQEYLDAVLQDQTLDDGSPQLKALQQDRKDVETLLRAEFGFVPSIRYGGSKAKGTMIRESYDLDLTCYFPRDDDSAGESLADIYDAVEATLQERYTTERKGSAIRLRSPDYRRAYIHIDVVPGRYVAGDEGDVHLYRTTGDKAYLKTNLQTHVEYVKNSGVRPAIRLLKLLAVQNHVGIKTFALELLVIKLLAGRSSRTLANQITHVLEEFRDDADGLRVEDPANPYGNDLSGTLGDAVRSNLEAMARGVLDRVERHGWGAVFGTVQTPARTDRAAALQRIAAAAPVRPKPYYSE